MKVMLVLGDLEVDVAHSQPSHRADGGHEDLFGVIEMTSDEPVSRTMTPPFAPSSPLAVVKDEAYSKSDSDAGSSVQDTDSKVSYSEMFSEKSPEQPTDPSSWLESSSADRAGTRGHPVDITFSGTKERLDVGRVVEECSQSISSVADSIGSAISDGGSLGQAGVNYVVAKFTQSDPELLALYTEASQRLTKDRFIDNNRRLLKMFYLDFVRQEQTPSQREAVAFFRSRRRRAEISLDIFRTVTPDYDANLSAEEHRKKFSMLNAYFETLDTACEIEPLCLYA